jgi:hypothetical protein
MERDTLFQHKEATITCEENWGIFFIGNYLNLKQIFLKINEIKQT